MNNNFFDNMQSAWLKSWNSLNFGNWPSHHQNSHFCNPSCSGLLQHWSNLAKETVDVASQNMDLLFNGVQQSVKSPNLESVLANNQQLAQELVGNSASYMRNAFQHMANASSSMYEHMQGAMMHGFYNQEEKGATHHAKKAAEK